MQVDQVSSPEFVQSLRERGYVLVTVPDEVRTQFDRTFLAAGRFFREPLAAKLTSRRSNDTGYRPFGIEFSSTSDHPDLMESFTVANRVNEALGDPETDFSTALTQQMLRTLAFTERIAEQALGSLLHAYGKTAAMNVEGMFKQWSILQLNFSRPCELQENKINDLHEDGCFLTVGAMPSAGLELKQGHDLYAPVTTAHNQVVIMAGEILSLMSGGQIQPCFHRVRTVPYLVERMSLLMFADISPKLCKPWVQTPANDQIDIGSRVLTNSTRFGLQEWSEDRLA